MLGSTWAFFGCFGLTLGNNRTQYYVGFIFCCAFSCDRNICFRFTIWSYAVCVWLLDRFCSARELFWWAWCDAFVWLGYFVACINLRSSQNKDLCKWTKNSSSWLKAKVGWNRLKKFNPFQRVLALSPQFIAGLLSSQTRA